MSDNHRTTNPFQLSLEDSLEMVRRNVNMLQMILDKNETHESMSDEQKTFLLNANSCLEEAIISFNSRTVRHVYNTNESVQTWINGDTLLIRDMMTCQLKGEIEQDEEEAAETMVEMMTEMRVPIGYSLNPQRFKLRQGVSRWIRVQETWLLQGLVFCLRPMSCS